MFKVSDKFQLISAVFFKETMRICTVLVMGRLIGPAENGAYLLVLAAGGLITSFSDLAIPQSLVQIEGFAEKELIDTAMFLINLLTFIYGFFTVGASLYLSHKYSDPRLWKIGILVALATQLGSIYSIQVSILNRKLQFRRESWQYVIFSLATAAAGISFALLHWGVYALVFQILAGFIAGNIAVCLTIPFQLPTQASWKAAKSFLRLGGPVSISSYVASVEGSLVGLVINSFAGQYGLGLWGKALQVQSLFAQNLMGSFQRVAYPLLCRSVSDRARMKTLFARTTITMLLVSGFFTALLGVNGRAMVRLVLGPMWDGTVPLLQISAFAVPAIALIMIGQMLAMSMGNNKPMLTTSILNICIFIPAVFLAKRWGLSGLAVCWTGSRYLIALTLIAAAAKPIATGLWTLRSELQRLTIATVISAVTMVGINRVLNDHAPAIVQLCVAGSVGLAIYYCIVRWLLSAPLAYAVQMALGASNNPPASPGSASAAPSVDSAAFVMSALGGTDEPPLPPHKV